MNGLNTKWVVTHNWIEINLKVKPADLQRIASEIDVDNSGTIEWAEFLYLVEK